MTISTIIEDRAAALTAGVVTLDRSAHDSFEEGHCAMEVVAWLAGEGHTDAPACASPVLAAYTIGINDRWDDEQRQKLVPYLPSMVDTRGDGQDQMRGFLAIDWLIRTYTPEWLDLAGLTEQAARLRDLGETRTTADLQSSLLVLKIVREEARTAWAAAGAAVWVAAGDAVRAAARDAAGAVAWDAVGVAVGDADWDAAGDAAWVAAGDAVWVAARDAAGAAAGAAAWAAARDAAWAAARDATWAVARDVDWAAAGAVAWDAAWVTAGDAAWVAAWAAARDAARDAAGAAAGAAARDAAGDAAGAAAGAALRPTVEKLQGSALELLQHLIDPAGKHTAE